MKPSFFFWLVAGGIVACDVTVAQETSYRAEISAADRVNSRGGELKTLKEFLRQDRFNVHGGHHLDPGDTKDTRFATPANRAMIDNGRLVSAPGLEAAVVSGRVTLLDVVVSGTEKSLLLRVTGVGDEGMPPAPVLQPQPAIPASSRPTLATGLSPTTEPSPMAESAPEGFRVAYATTLGPRDWVDSNGAPWTRLRDVLKQDRANVNRLGKADPGDEREIWFTSAAERVIFDSVPLSLDPMIAGPLARRETVKVTVLVASEGDRMRVGRPDADERSEMLPEEELLEDRAWKTEALAVSGDPGASAGLRDLIRMTDLIHGHGHEKAVLARVKLAGFLLQSDAAAEAGPLLGEIERDFRAAAGREVGPDSIVAVMGFLVQARRLLREDAAAKRLLDELLESPGRWHLDEARREELRSLLDSGGAGKSPEATERPTYGEVLARWERIDSDPEASTASRLAALVETLSVHPKRRGADYDLLLGRLAERVEPIDRTKVDDETFLPLADGLLFLALDEFRRGKFEAAKRRCEETLAFLDSPARQEQMPGIPARELLVRLATAAGKPDEAETLARSHFEWAVAVFQPYDGRLLQLATQYLELLADRGAGAAIEAVAKPVAERNLVLTDVPYPGLRLAWHELTATMIFDAGDEAGADAWYRRALAAADGEAGLRGSIGGLYSAWGMLYEGKGRYGRAEEIWSEGVERLEPEASLVADYVSLLQDLSLVRKHYRDEQGAIDLIEKSRSLAAEKLGTDSTGYAVACNNLVLPLNAMGRGDEALRMADEALRVAANHPDREWARESATIYRNNRAILLMGSDPAAAGEIYASIVAEMEAMGRHEDPRLALFYMNLGAARRETRDFDGAEDAFRSALGILENQGWEDQRNLSIVLDALAVLAMRKGRVAEAVDHVRESVRLAESYLQNASAIASESEKLALGSLFETGDDVHILLAAGATEEACELSLRSKGTVMDQSIREAKALQGLADDADKRKLVAELRARQRQFQRVSLALQQGGAPPAGDPALGTLRREMKRIQGLLLESGPGSPSESGTVNLETVRKRLGAGERFHEFVVATDLDGESYLGAFVITADSLKWVKLGGAEMTRIAVKRFRESVDAYLAAATDESRADASATLEKASRRLHALIWEPLAPPAEEKGRVVLCPDGPVHFVPFAVLLDAANRFPGEDRIFDYVSSARDFCRENGGSGIDLSSAVVVGGPDYRQPLAGEAANPEEGASLPLLVEATAVRSGIGRALRVDLTPLPGAAKEAGLVAETLRGGGTEVTLLTAAEATERAVAGASGPSIVHVATHGVFFDLDFGAVVSGRPGGPGGGIDPMLRGALALTGAQSAVGSWEQARFPPADDDGWLFAAEAVQLDLRGTELVTLSACETGIGDLASGEGVIGLRRAFLAAGARHVLSTLWAISDEMTVELMRDFYERLEQGAAVNAAFAGAQGEALRVFRSENARGEAIALFGAFVINRAGS
jgi:CHAT domain-containing protein/tetratricopeptide (TPR) repeat protein